MNKIECFNCGTTDAHYYVELFYPRVYCNSCYDAYGDEDQQVEENEDEN